MKSYHPERGAAFLYVMLIFIAASLVIGGLLGTGYREVDRTERFLNELQARQYALGAEMIARQKLLDIAPLWQSSQQPFNIAQGTVVMDIEDLQGRFNVNSLLADNLQGAQHFKKLCAGLGISDKTVATVLAQLEPLKPPPPAPGVAPIAPVWMMDASELVDHLMPVDDYLKLAPYITALPLESFSININTASDVVLLAYLEKPEQLDMIHDLIKTNGAIANDKLTPLQNHDNSLATSSSAWRLHVTVNSNGQFLHLHSALLRLADQKKIIAIARNWGE